jgi:hypothetical protein
MGCCGQRRDILRRPPAPTPPERIVRAPALVRFAGPPAAPAPPDPRKIAAVASAPPVPRTMAGVTLEYTERARILVRGPAAGRTYGLWAGPRGRTVGGADVAPWRGTALCRPCYGPDSSAGPSVGRRRGGNQTVRNTRPGMVLREFGLAWTKSTAPIQAILSVAWAERISVSRRCLSAHVLANRCARQR